MLAAAVAILDLVIVWLAGPGALLLLIAVLIGATLVISAALAPDRPPASRLSWRGSVNLWLGEILAAWSLFLCWLPLERVLMRRDQAGKRANTPPVLLIHGYVNNAGALWRLWRSLCHNGFGVFTLNLEPVYGDIGQYVPLIAARIESIRAVTGSTHVTLVCHSMGGLAARAYLRRSAQERVDPGVAKVITLGTPHHGTVLARIERSRNGRQMHPNSAWLTQLAEHEGGAWVCPLVSIYSLDDNVVVPATSARLDGARNIELAGIGHISLPLSRRVIALVLSELDTDLH